MLLTKLSLMPYAKSLVRREGQKLEWTLIYIFSLWLGAFSEGSYLEWERVLSLFLEEISPCVAVHTCYVMDACNRVRSIILLLHMAGTSFMLVVLKGLNVSEPKHRVTWSHRTGINFPFLRGKRIQYFGVSA